MNAACERVIGTLRRELLDRILILSEHHLELMLHEYLIHYTGSGRQAYLDRAVGVRSGTRRNLLRDGGRAAVDCCARVGVIGQAIHFW